MQEKSTILQYHDWQTEALQDTLIVGYLNNKCLSAWTKLFRNKIKGAKIDFEVSPNSH